MAGECSEELEAPSDEVIVTTTGTEEPIRSIDGQSFDDKPTPTPSPPDRNLFQSSLSEINACISQHTKRVSNFTRKLNRLKPKT